MNYVKLTNRRPMEASVLPPPVLLFGYNLTRIKYPQKAKHV